MKDRTRKRGFTLIELLVVVGVMSVLVSLLVPALAEARQQAREVLCKTNLRQLAMANIGYAGEGSGRFVVAAADIVTANLKRWHGERADTNNAFEARRGPLARYLGDGQVKECPTRVAFRHGDPWRYDYEDGCGGYGYNLTYVGSLVWTGQTWDTATGQSTPASVVARPEETIMFADTAMAKMEGGQAYYLEYSFVEPPHFIWAGGEELETWLSSPSMHFRHNGRSNVAWVDGHVGDEVAAACYELNVYGVNSGAMGLGWPEPLDNRWFDLK